jgi:hypothetical protein
MNRPLFIGMLLVSAPALSQTQGATSPAAKTPLPAAGNLAQPDPRQPSHDPWDIVPAIAPYRNWADALKTTSKPGEASPLNPSCEGKTGDACVRSEEPPRR